MSKQTRSTLLLLIAVLGVCAYAYFGVYQKEQKETEQKAVSSKVFDLKEEDIAGLEFKWIGSEGKVSRNEKNEWVIVSPVQDSTDTTELNTLFKNISNHSVFTEISSEPGTDLKIYGLDNPMGFLKITLKAGGTKTFELSQTEGLGDKRYGRIVETNRVFALESHVADSFTKGLKDLRDKRVLRIPTSHIMSLKVLEKGKLVAELSKKETDWAYVGKDWAVDQSQVKAYLNRLENLRAESFLEDGKSQSAVFEIQVAKDDGVVEKIFASATKDSKSTVWTSSRPTNYQLAGAQVEGLLVKSDFFRSKKAPFEFDKSKVEKIEVRTELTKIEVERKDGVWTEPKAKESKLDQTQVAKLLDMVSELSAAEFLGEQKKAAFGQTLGSVTLLNKEGKPELELKWGRELSGENRIVLTNKSGEALAVNKTSLASLPLQTLREAKPKQEEAKK